MVIALVKNNVVDNIIVAEPDFVFEDFVSIPVDEVLEVRIGDTLYYEGEQLIHQSEVNNSTPSEIEILKQEVAEQKALINAILGVTE